MNETRPDPDDLLRRVKADEEKSRCGKLTVFFGAAPGVGKTYAMLTAARAERADGRRVVEGVVETHGRPETAALLADLPRIPRRRVEHRGVPLDELDLDAALAQKPEILLVDELAHTNAEGSRHKKRWQDVLELLDAGINVYTTVNVQHIESLNDVIAQITGVRVRETVPDSMLEEADEIKLVDLSPDDLLDRLREGKVYIPSQAQRAIESFFKKGNLIALRELALRQTAARVDAQMQEYRRAHGIEKTWAASDRILVCVSPSPHSAELVRAGRRMASALKAEWLTVYVETPAALRMPASARAQLSQNLALAVKLGAETMTLSGERPAEEILRFARSRNVTKIIVGKPTLTRVLDRLRSSFVDEIVRGSEGIDVYFTSGEEAPAPAPPGKSAAIATRARASGYLAAAASAAIATAVGALVFERSNLADVVMIYLLGIVLTAMRCGFGPSLLATVLSVLSFNFYFIPPYYTFAVTDLRHVTTFGVMLLVAIVISGLTRRVHAQAEAARARERRTAALYAMSRELSRAPDEGGALKAAARHVAGVFQAKVALFAPSKEGDLAEVERSDDLEELSEKERGVARWVFSNRREAGLGTGTLPGGQALYTPLVGSRGIVGVLGVSPRDPERFADPEERRFLDAFASLLATAMERARLAEESEAARLAARAEELRSALLSSVSHDLRTPLAVMTGSASALLDKAAPLDEATRLDLLQSIYEGARRLNRLVGNLLDMTRLESGAMEVKREWQPIEEVVGSALTRLEEQLEGREIRTHVPPGLPLAHIDGTLIEQVLVNLIENATKYGGDAGPIEVSAAAEEGAMILEVADRGPGVAPGEEEKIFDKFHRAPGIRAARGFGLGLSICRGMVAAHGGRIWVENRAGGGASFKLSLPQGEPPPPALPPEPAYGAAP